MTSKCCVGSGKGIFWVVFIFLIAGVAGLVNAQVKTDISIVSKEDFARMESLQKGDLLQKWINYSYTTSVPPEVEQKALSFYDDNHIDKRLYQKSRLLLQVVCNGSLPLSNRIIACEYILTHFSNPDFPLALVEEILIQLRAQNK